MVRVDHDRSCPRTARLKHRETGRAGRLVLGLAVMPNRLAEVDLLRGGFGTRERAGAAADHAADYDPDGTADQADCCAGSGSGGSAALDASRFARAASGEQRDCADQGKLGDDVHGQCLYVNVRFCRTSDPRVITGCTAGSWWW